MRKLTVALLASLVPMCALAAVSQAELDVSRDKAIVWLVKNQQPDGHWASAQGLDVQTTSAVVDALIASNHARLPQLAAAVAWLQNAEAGSTDALARQIIALKRAGADVAATRLLKTLQDRRNLDDKGWGAYPGYRASIPDTPLAMLALQAAGAPLTDTATLAATFEASSLTPGPGQRYWLYRMSTLGSTPGGETVGEPVLPTALTMLALKAWGLSSAQVGSAGNFLKAKQGTSGIGQGAFTGVDGLFTPLDTAMAGAALAATGARTDAAVQAALDQLKRSQSVAGDWSGDALSTAVALQLVGVNATPVADTDGDGVPDSIEAYLGTDIQKADAKKLAATNTGVNTPAGPSAVTYAYSGLRGKPMAFKLPITDATGCCTTTSGSLPAGVTVSASGAPLATVQLSGTPTEVGHFYTRLSYQTPAGVDKVVQLRVEIEPTLFRVDADPFDLAALFASDADLNKLKSGWQATVDDFDNDGRPDVIAYFSGANEAFNRLNCSPCTPYAGPDWGQLIAYQNRVGTYGRFGPLLANAKFPGDLRSIQVVDFDNDGKKDLVLNLNKVSTASADPADKSASPFRSVVLLRNDTPVGDNLRFTDVTAAMQLDVAPEGDVVILDANRDGVPDFVVSNGSNKPKLYIYNKALAVYEDKSAGSGLGGALRQPVGFDFDGDAYRTVDLVSLDPANGLVFYRNNGNGIFTALANETSLPTLGGKRINRIVPADIDGDGLHDLVLFETATLGSGAAQAYAGSRVTVVRHGGINASAQPRFTIQPDTALTSSQLPDAVNRGGLVADIDDDGKLDIVVAAKDGSSTKLENAIYRQQLDGTFNQIIAATGFPANVAAHDSPIYVDLDDDGKADLFWPNASNQSFRLINEGNLHHAIDVIVKGKASNRSALGARVVVSTPDGQTQTRQVLAQHATASTLHFGLGTALSAMVTVKWPDGTQQVMDVNSVDRVVTIAQP